jgi:hypothetical protein
MRTAARGGTTGAEEDVDARLRAEAAYDLANTYFAQHAWDNAIEAYKTALRLAPGSRDASWVLPRNAAWNLELARRLRELERNPPDAGQDAAPDVSPPDASQDAGRDAGQDGGDRGDGGNNQGDGGSQQGDSGAPQGNDGGSQSPDAGGQTGDAGAPPPGDASVPRSMAPLDELDRTARSLQHERLRRMQPVQGTSDDR